MSISTHAANVSVRSVFIAQNASTPSSVSAETPSIGMVLLGEIAPGWRVTQPMLVTLEKDEAGFIASDDIFCVYGTGETFVAARQDYIQSLIEYCELLEARAERNGPTRSQFRNLGYYIVKTTDQP